MWRPHLQQAACLQLSRNARERAVRFFAAAATSARAYQAHQFEHEFESFEVNLESAWAELEIAHYWQARVR